MRVRPRTYINFNGLGHDDTVGGKGVYDVLRALGDDARNEQDGIVLHDLTNVGSHTNDDICHDIGADQIVGTLGAINALEQVGDVTDDVIASVLLDVIARDTDGDLIDIIRAAKSRAKL